MAGLMEMFRQAVPSDATAIAHVDAQSWPPTMAIQAQQALARILAFPQGQLVAELQGRIVAMSSSQRITEAFLQEAGSSYERLTDNDRFTASHTDAGEIWQLIGVGVLPAARGRQLGRKLVDRQIALARSLPGVRRIIGFTRPAGFHRHPDLTLEEYLSLRDEQGRHVDPVIDFHVSAGARIVSWHGDFRPADVEARGCGVLIEYPLTAET